MTPPALRAFYCWLPLAPFPGRTVHARSASKARREYHLDVSESWPDVRYIDVRSELEGSPRDDEGFRRMAEYRGIPFARIGMRVLAEGHWGNIVGHNSSSNLNVLTDAGVVLNCHPTHGVTYYADDSSVACRFERGKRIDGGAS